MKKQWFLFVCTGMLTVSGILSPLHLLNAKAAPYTMERGAYRLEDGTPIEGVFARGIDVSHWKGDIDWKTVADNDVQFVMLGTTYKGGEDPKFRENAAEAAKAGVRVGAYLYSHATTPEMAEEEADFILDLIKDYPISYPVAFDVEENSTSGTLAPDELSHVINAFCKKIEDAGYHPLVYASDYWLANKIDLSLLEYDVWVARYGALHTFEDPVMWQATNTGAIEGIHGHVDIDFQYTDFSPHLPADQWRTIGDKTYYYQDYVMQKNTWIDDGTGWFYIGEDALAEKGWLKLDDNYYYLDDLTGRMATGWLNQNGIWYYLDNSGVMQTGWLNLDGNYYYLNKDGSMQTGWLKDGKYDYYLSASSGKMTVGWREIDHSWYYFNASGAKKTGWQNINNVWYYLNESGQMQTGWQKLNNIWYYLNESGQMQTGWQKLNNIWYYLNESGQMMTGWQNVNGSWYYLNESGQMMTGMIQLQEQLYYLDPSTGIMAANTDLTLNGVNYHADASGICTEIITEETGSEESQAPSEGEPPATQAPSEGEPPATQGSSGSKPPATQVPSESKPPVTQVPAGPGAFLP